MNSVQSTMYSRKAAIVFAFMVWACNAAGELFHERSPRHVKILILGAGMSGIKAAETLHKNGITNFLVLEGKDYIGGRVKHVQFEGNLVPLGAGWIHGIGAQNPLWRQAEELNLKVHFDNYTDFIIRDGETGKLETTSYEVLSHLKRITNKADKIIAKRQKTGKSDVPFKSILSMAGWHGKTNLYNAVEYYHFDFKVGVSPDVTSSRSYGVTGESGIDAIVTDGRGYAHIIENLAKSFKNKVILNTVISEIKHSDSYVKVTTKNGEQYTADHVLITFSPGVLINNMVTFKPALPDWKIESMNLIPMSYYCKVFFKFPVRFWDNVNYIMLAQKDRGAYVHWQNFDRKTLLNGEHILLLTMTENQCLKSETLSDKQITMEAMTALRKVFGNRIPWPTAIIRSAWNKDPMTMGAYSNRLVGFEAEDLKRLKASVGRLWFAGEYAVEDYGFLHGAYESGEKTAMKIIRCLRSGKCPQYTEKRSPRCVTKGT